ALPGEKLAIKDGDLFAGDEIIRKTAAELNQVRILVHDNDYQPRERRSTTPRWRPQPDNANWQAQGTGFRLEQKPGERGSWEWLEYEHWSCTADPRRRGVAAPV